MLLRSELSREIPGIVERWRTGPLGPPPRERAALQGRPPLFSVRPGSSAASVAGSHARPDSVVGHAVVAQLRIRRDVPGALVALADGRYAVTGPLIAVGPRADLSGWARRRLRSLDADAAERVWLQNVVGALAADVPA